MSAGVLLVTPYGIGSELLRAATTMLGDCPLPAKALSIGPQDDRDRMIAAAESLAADLDDGEGLLVLTDLFGSTPCNIANALSAKHRVRVLSGVNLPMLVRIFNYASLPLDELVAKALSGAHDGVMLCSETDCEPRSER
ncbi:phosphotransferase system, mannose/fructose-specific component IIA [Thioflavicoccus mobilis 8321]|uniref:Phosphotransferase system, mannose/fructose-specific component IIA n=1 Tax=Thioflavicoccus mobilis 8321 TaxID=765912 RepID=L0GZV1_9GAMM|nr:PTS mannose/fructose transporter subunit IIA [Thioflavicoccus mobilis]AGA91476.1 phosphotransferase system, mannose/fructose-specific component IIA [Thioflavicoccus mobilis 8321]